MLLENTVSLGDTLLVWLFMLGSLDSQTIQELLRGKTIGSNVLLKGQTLRPQAAKGWRVLLQNRRFRNWQAAFAKIRTDFSTSGCGG
ncbi:hypothetical protein A3H90_01020 [Candidatus Peribacteria bacterium RIFCSPLOWO2_02_FULL_55_36]|nr:MAG: hypothetical protein A3H90_01020 [Candidatus Peribacteria bacterium RIFCSPLOWO2_02_FULL_55_36]